MLCGKHEDLERYQIEHTKWQELQHILLFLRPFAEVTQAMSGQTYPTLYGVIVYFNTIWDYVDKYIKGGFDEKWKLSTPVPDIVREAAVEASKVLSKYYNKTHTMHCIVILLDPRLKKEYFKVNKWKTEMTTPFIDR
jgi:Domain of unknown function (DUF4413)